MPALEQAQYELREAKREILKLTKAVNQRDILITDRVADIVALQSELDELKLKMRSRSYLQALLSAITDEEVGRDE